MADSRSPLPIFGSVNNTLDLLSYVRCLRTVTPSMFLDAKVSFSRKTNNQRWPNSNDKDWAEDRATQGWDRSADGIAIKKASRRRRWSWAPFKGRCKLALPDSHAAVEGCCGDAVVLHNELMDHIDRVPGSILLVR